MQSDMLKQNQIKKTSRFTILTFQPDIAHLYFENCNRPNRSFYVIFTYSTGKISQVKVKIVTISDIHLILAIQMEIRTRGILLENGRDGQKEHRKIRKKNFPSLQSKRMQKVSLYSKTN